VVERVGLDQAISGDASSAWFAQFGSTVSSSCDPLNERNRGPNFFVFGKQAQLGST
jgi:hypothetical protein